MTEKNLYCIFAARNRHYSDDVLLVTFLKINVMRIDLEEWAKENAKKKRRNIPFLQNAILPYINEANLEIIPINYNHVVRLETLEREPIHKDPFDRLLIAQCIEERLTFITSDNKVALYEKYGLDYIQYELN